MPVESSTYTSVSLTVDSEDTNYRVDWQTEQGQVTLTIYCDLLGGNVHMWLPPKLASRIGQDLLAAALSPSLPAPVQ